MSSPDTPARGPGPHEFIALMALMISLVALSIDAMLPALSIIGEELRVANPSDVQLVISALFVGMTIGQLVYGPVSDATGRRGPILVGFVLFIAGSLVCMLAQDFSVMLAGRVLQGVGAAGPRIVTLAIVRDRFAGVEMARVMSIVMAVFIIVPALAPALGQAVMLVAGWRMIFATLLVVALITATWFVLRQPETLARERRRPISAGNLIGAVGEVLAHRVSLGFTLAAGSVFGAFLAYLGTAQQIFQYDYGLGTRFPLLFGVLALAIGGASLLNARLVMRYGMRRPSLWAAWLLCALSALFWLIALAVGGLPPLWVTVAWMLPAFGCIGILFGNLNAQAMEPLGHIAGVGAAVVGSLSVLISLPLGIYIGSLIDGTVLPLAGGFTLLSALSAACMHWSRHR